MNDRALDTGNSVKPVQEALLLLRSLRETSALAEAALTSGDIAEALRMLDAREALIEDQGHVLEMFAMHVNGVRDPDAVESDHRAVLEEAEVLIVDTARITGILENRCVEVGHQLERIGDGRRAAGAYLTAETALGPAADP